MKRKIIILAILLIAGHCTTEFYHIIRWCDGEYINKELDLFLSPHFKMKLNVVYYAKFMADDLLFCISFYVLAQIAYEYSIKIFWIAWVYFIYHVIDSFMFWWDYKTNYSLYYFLLAAVVVSTIILILPLKQKKSIYKSMI